MVGNRIVFILLTVVTLGVLTNACDSDQMRYGCRIFNALCNCGFGCKSEYRYESFETCKLALKGQQDDICHNEKPCLHDGLCLQITQNPGFKCQCEGTGYYGTRCDKQCPGRFNLRFPFPHQCVVI